ncbi:hypothetical protein AD006_11680 [Pseudonocardia sp. EC080610-09]|uniref:hypothetical protein n=1 Tax=unclassified Pseudonocardia TaxID=2619320 RepID=UPI0006CB79E1|nr:MULTISPECIES: hypothetical protein [unclassified Pseudonocardia]ALE72492.1 hypothetical protein FRP1_04025 [Pseudonocardia sp. EC080625-04]ALL75799.1 hypothetical protein AD006_11680 [Pseudonocardia sp. EC080610-09]ALL82826.1 hypothetical protein AD017_19505 [Pseudonocardia sp. EC080619-01]
MSDTPELDQVADARRRIAAHAGFPVAYWVLLGVALVFIAGLPIWSNLLNLDPAYTSWALAAIGITSAVYSVLRRRRSGVHLPKRIGAYPSARPSWMIGLAIALAGFIVINLLVREEQQTIALLVLPVVAVGVFVAQVRTRSAMRRDIEAGRVRP